MRRDKYSIQCVFLATLITAVLPRYANAAECVASGASLNEAVSNYAQNCSVSQRDCDQVQGQWYCSSENITEQSQLHTAASQQNPVATVPSAISLNNTSDGSAAIVQQNTDCIDENNDGWGWNGVASCRVGAVAESSVLSADRGVQNVAQQIQGAAECIDSDNDGWGWNGVESCRVGATVNSSNTNLTEQSAPFAGSGGQNQLQDGLQCIDEDNDGWGWNGVESCRVGATVNSSNTNLTEQSAPFAGSGGQNQLQDGLQCIDEDNDGWGWNGVESCQITSSVKSTGIQSDNSAGRFFDAGSDVSDNCAKLESGNYHITELVTDVFLTAGQSNAAGNKTRYEPNQHSQDRVNNRVLVWTENNRWEVANPATQTWHNGKFPGTRYVNYNHPAFQIGRAIADQDGCRVVAFIATAASGKPIDHWRHNLEGHYSHIQNTVTNAINALPGRHQVDMIWWMQGEADNDQVIERYFSKLTDLIAKFRSESWFQWDGYFLANETGWSPYANQAIRLLAGDGSNYTDYSRGEDSAADRFPHIAEEVQRTHFNEVALRKIGDLVAGKYLYEYLKNK